MATPVSPTTSGNFDDNNTRDFYQQISHWLNEFFRLTSYTDIEYSIRSSFPNLSTTLSTSGGSDGSYTVSFPYEPKNRISIPSATITSIPSTINEQQVGGQTGSSTYRSGFFYSLNMVWLSTDNKLYLWKYPTTLDLIALEFDSIILACECVRRQKSTSTNVTKRLTHSTSFLGSWLPSVLSSTAKHPSILTSNDLVERYVHLLLILTSQDILIYTIDDQSSLNVQRWYSTPTLKYSLNQIGYFNSLATSGERFFLGGQCADIYEFIYEDNVKSTLNKLGQTFLSNLVPSFLQIGSSYGNSASTSVKQITIDHQRHLLYARLENDSLHIYDISTDKGQRLFTYTFDDLVSKLKPREPISYDDFRPILTMYTVQAYESSLFNLILVTRTGTRLYYNLTLPSGPQQNNTINNQQARLELIHVRYAPDTSSSSHRIIQKTAFRTGYVDMNCMFLFTTDPSRPQTFGQMILVVNSDASILTSNALLSNSFSDVRVNQQQNQLLDRSNAVTQSQFFNELVLVQDQITLLMLNIVPLHVDLTETPKHLPRMGALSENFRYMIQAYDSIVTFVIPRSTEHLRLLLFYDQQIHSLFMKQFFSYYSLRYSCTMSLALTLTSTLENSNTSRLNDDRLRDLAFQTFLWYSSSAYLQYLESVQQQQQQHANQYPLDQSRLYPFQNPLGFNRSTPILSSNLVRQRNFFENHIIPIRINAILFVLSDILRPVWNQTLVELRPLSKQDKTVYYIFHSVYQYQEIKALLKQIQHFMKKLAPHMCCVWSPKDDLPEYNEQLAQRIIGQQNSNSQTNQPQQQQTSNTTNTNLYLRSALAGRFNENHPQHQSTTLHHTQSYPNIANFAQSPFGQSNILNSSLTPAGPTGPAHPAADLTFSSPAVPSNGGLFGAPTQSLTHSTSTTNLFSNLNGNNQLGPNSSAPNNNAMAQQYFPSASSLSSVNDLLQEIDYYRTTCHMIDRLTELLSLWQILNEHRTDMLIERLPEIYLNLFNGTSGPFTARTLLDLDNVFYDKLVAALLTSYEQNESTFDQLMGRLVDECPKLCPIEKLILYKVDLFLKPSTTSTQSYADQHQRLKQACQLYKQVCDRVNINSFAMTLYNFRMYDELLDLCVTSSSKRDPCNQAINYYYGQNEDQQQYIDVHQRRAECLQTLMDVLTALFQRDGPGVSMKTMDGTLTLDEFLRHCLSYDDEFMHVKIFEWMTNQQLNEKLKSFRQISPYLERFIRHRLKVTNFNDFFTLDVAIAVLQVAKDYTTLCQVLLHLIDLGDARVNFEARLRYLAEALQIARSAGAASSMKSSSDRQLIELIPSLEQRLQTAFVQKQIYADLQMFLRALQVNPNVSLTMNNEELKDIHESIDRLDLALFDATELFVDYAQKYELYECQLLLLQLDGNEEPTILQTIWRRLLRKEFNDLYPASTTVLQQHLSERLRNCRKKRLRLPLDFIRSELKQIVYNINQHSAHGEILSEEDFVRQVLSDL